MAREGLFADKKMINVVTPVGEALWCKVTEPDYKFDKDGRYSCTLILNPEDEETKKFSASIDKMLEDALAVAKESIPANKRDKIMVNNPLDDDYDREGNPTGKWVIKSKTKASYNGDPTDMPIYDVHASKLEGFSKMIGNGSKIKLQVGLKEYYIAATNTVGVSVRLKRVQIIELNEYDGNSGGDGFVDEAGSEYEETPFASTGADF